jgi:nitrogen-specific signal transduction histidine kinase
MDITTVVDHCVELVRTMVPKTIRIELETLPPIPRIAGDSVEIQQIVTNLCLNAVQSIPASRGAERPRSGNGIHCALPGALHPSGIRYRSMNSTTLP